MACFTVIVGYYEASVEEGSVMFMHKAIQMPDSGQALPGRETPMPVPEAHFVNGHPLVPPFPEGLEQAVLGMGCFWGAERRFWELDGVLQYCRRLCGRLYAESAYREVCSGMTGHNEVVLVVFDPVGSVISNYWPASGTATIPRRGCARVTMSVRSIDPAFIL